MLPNPPNVGTERTRAAMNLFLKVGRFCVASVRSVPTLGRLGNIMPHQFQSVFERLRDILKKHAEAFTAVKDASDHYSLEAPVGPVTLQDRKSTRLNSSHV